MAHTLLTPSDARKQMDRQAVQREIMKSPFPSRFTFRKDERLRNPLEADPLINKNMNVDGSSTPVSFRFAPASDEVVVINYLTLLVLDSGTFLANEFGSLGSALTNGLKVNVQQNGIAEELTSLTNNADILQCFGQATGIPGPGTGANTGIFGSPDWLAGKYMLDDELVLFGDTSDFIDLQVNDDLTAIDFIQSTIRIKSIIL